MQSRFLAAILTPGALLLGQPWRHPQFRFHGLGARQASQRWRERTGIVACRGLRGSGHPRPLHRGCPGLVSQLGSQTGPREAPGVHWPAGPAGLPGWTAGTLGPPEFDGFTLLAHVPCDALVIMTFSILITSFYGY